MIYCMGSECSVRHTCLRYTQRKIGINSTEGGYTTIRKCTNQRRYLQDESTCNQDGKQQRK